MSDRVLGLLSIKTYTCWTERALAAEANMPLNWNKQLTLHLLQSETDALLKERQKNLAKN